MAHKTMVGGTTYDITGGRTLVGGTGYGIKKGRTLVGGTGYDITFGVPVDPIFSNNDWATIIAACEAKAVPDTWKVGDSKPMSIDGTDYLIDIIGKDHDTYTAGGTAPLTFQMHDTFDDGYKMNSSNMSVWATCEMRTTHLPAFLALMPAEVQASVKEVNKKTTAGNQSTTITTTADKLFLLSEIEVAGEIAASASGEGTWYAYYANGGSQVKVNSSGSAQNWWLRSPRVAVDTHFCRVTSTGRLAYYQASGAGRVSFAFCF